MIDELMTIYATRPTLNLPPVAGGPPASESCGQRDSRLVAENA
jgi:hypothetical protein